METIGNKTAILFPIVSIQPLACFYFANVNSLMLSGSDLPIHKNRE